MCNFGVNLMRISPGKWLLLVCVMMATTVGAEIVIDKEPKDALIKEGEPAILECVGHSSSSADASYRCSWLKDGTVMFVGEGKRKQFYDWIGDYRSGNCSIMLQNTLVSRHQGKWRCQIINTETDDNEMASTSSALVTILVAPTLPEIQDKSGNRLTTMTIVEGSRQELHCISRHGNPAAYLRWELNGQDVSGNATFYNNSEPSLTLSGDAGNTLRMYTAGSWLSLLVNRTLDQGVLQCLSRHAAFSEDRVQNTSLELNIIYPPKNMSNDNNLTVAMDETVELDCPLDGKPAPSYIWYQLKKTDPIGFQKLLRLNNLSDNFMDTGYYCSASTLMGSQNLTAYSGMFVLTPIMRSAELVKQCCRDDVALYLVIALGTFAVMSLAFEFVLLVYFKCHKKNAPGQSFFRNTIYELYYTRGRKMALVHVRGEHDDKGGKGYTLHISAPFVSVFILILDLLTIAAYVISVIFCYYENSCHCTFLNPSIICTIIFGSIVIILQLVFLASFCIRKKEDSKYRSYARRKEDVPGAETDSSPKRVKNSASIINPIAIEQNENTIKQSNKNDRSRTEVPGSVPV